MYTSTGPSARRFFFFFFNDTATTEIYTLSLHDALPICEPAAGRTAAKLHRKRPNPLLAPRTRGLLRSPRSEEHTSELQSRLHLVCRLLLEKKKAPQRPPPPTRHTLALTDSRSTASVSTT